MIIFINIDGINIEVDSIYQCSNIKTKTKTLIVNGKYILNQRSPIVYECDACHKIFEAKFRLRDKYFEKMVLCKKCNTEKTSLEKFGSKSFLNSEECKAKIRKTKKEKYGNEFYTNRKKAEETSLERYGDKNYTNREKSKQTTKKNYGVECVFSLEEYKEKIKETHIKNLGVEYPFQSAEVKRKIDTTNLNKYGTIHPMKNKNVSSKMGNTIGEKIKNDFVYKLFNNRLKNVQPLFKEEEYKTSLDVYSWKCLLCGNDFKDNLAMGKQPRCPICYPKYAGTSILENEIKDFIKTLKIIINENNTSIIPPQELDIYLPDYKLAFEFDGLYWHSDLYKDRNYHIQKTEECEKQDIQLIHIFEDEWISKQEIVKSRIKNLLGLNSNRIGARKCIIAEIDAKTKNQFLDKYHIQGTDKSVVKLGAYHEDELVGVMTFSKPRVFMNKKNKEGVWEMSRFATIADTYTPGLASKMLTYFERKYKPQIIESFADRRWSQGNLYKQLGFELIETTTPNYWYFNENSKRYHRYNFRKSELKKFENYSDDKTEYEIMDEAGWLRIYDCGSYKFIKKYVD